jgi:hypothetical protein
MIALILAGFISLVLFAAVYYDSYYAKKKYERRMRQRQFARLGDMDPGADAHRQN